MTYCNRRDFLKGVAGTTIVASGVCQTIAPSALAYTPKKKPKEVKKIATTCEMCKANCPMVATVYSDGSIRLAGNSNNPIHGALLCGRGLAATQLLTSPDRLKYPMKRVGKRGQGKWQRISWDAATAEIGRHIKKTYRAHGGDGFALFSGGRSARHIKSFFANLGCVALSDSSYDRSKFIRTIGYGTTFGVVPDPSLIHLESSQCIVLLGTHIGENVLVPQVKQLSAALDRADVELVVVDPRFSAPAAKAHHYLAIKPGTDTALILGWINYLIKNELYDTDFVENSCLGFDELRSHVSRYSLEKTAQITDLPKAHIAGVAEIMAQAGSATTLVPGNQLSWYGNDVSRVRALAILSALLGVVPPDSDAFFDFNSISKPVDVAQIFSGIRAKKIGVVGIWGQNTVQSESPGFFVTKTFKDAEFIFCTDIFPSETSLYADIILPEASFLERDDYCKTWTSSGRKIIAGSFQVQEPLFESKAPYDIVKAIATASGFLDQFSKDSVQRLHQLQAESEHTSLDGLIHAGGVVIQRIVPKEPEAPVDVEERADLESPVATDDNGEPLEDVSVDPFLPPEIKFKTPSGKVELTSSWLSHNGFSSLPQYVACMAVPDGYVRLLSGRCPIHTLSRTSGNSWLNHEIPENKLWLSEATAATYSIKNGDRVRLENADGVKSVNRIEVLVSPGIRDDCCYASHGFGNLSPLMHEGYNKGISVNRLLSRSKKDVVTGVRGLRDIFVRFARG